MNTTRYVFAGNRIFVLEKMLELGLPIVRIYAVRDSYLARQLTQRGLSFETLPRKTEFVQALHSLDFDVFVCNGCPIILPISELTSGNRKQFINIHPSLLPDLRGSDPVPGAVLFGRKSGATCQVMNDQIDAGDIIAQVEIGETDSLDVSLLYQLSFLAEGDVFVEAWQRKFVRSKPQEVGPKDIYYTIKPSDQIIRWDEDAQAIVRRTRAFGNRSKGARFTHRECEFKAFDADWLRHPYVATLVSSKHQNEVCFVYERRLALAKDGGLLVLKEIEGDLSQVQAGDILGIST